MQQDYRKPDYYTDKAKKAGFLARSVFKLEEMDKKLRLLKSGFKVLDLGAAPGSWSQYVSKKVGPKGFLLAVDQKDLKFQANNLFFYRKDIMEMDEEFLAEILSQNKLKNFDVVLSDVAPDTSGIAGKDAALSLELSEKVFEIAEGVLKKGGCCVCKIFESFEAHQFVKNLARKYQTVKTFRPQAVRPQSKEFYIVARKKL